MKLIILFLFLLAISCTQKEVKYCPCVVTNYTNAQFIHNGQIPSQNFKIITNCGTFVSKQKYRNGDTIWVKTILVSGI